MHFGAEKPEEFPDKFPLAFPTPGSGDRRVGGSVRFLEGKGERPRARIHDGPYDGKPGALRKLAPYCRRAC